MAVAAGVGGRFRVGMGSNVSVGIDSDIDSDVGLASDSVGEVNSSVAEKGVGVRVGSTAGMDVSGIRAKVGNWVDGTETQAVKKKHRKMVREKRRNIIEL
jgi:hypothetical protein